MSKQFILALVGKWVVGKAYPTIKELAQLLESDNTMSGHEKKAKIIEALQRIGLSLIDPILELGISLARTALHI